MPLEDLFGWIAAIFITLILVPQIYKAFTSKMTRDISMVMLLFSFVGNLSLLFQSILIHNVPIIVCASLVVLMSAILIIFKYNNEKNSPDHAK